MFSLRTTWLHHLMCARPWSRLLQSCGLNMHFIYGLWLGIGVCEFLQIFLGIKTFTPFPYATNNYWLFLTAFKLLLQVFFLLSVDNLFCKYNWESFQRPWYVKPDVFNGNYITTTISLSKQKSSVTSLSDQDITSPHNFNTA